MSSEIYLICNMIESSEENCWNDEEPVKAPNWDEVETRIQLRRHDLKVRQIKSYL